ncbi:MAG: hypothetical protein H7Y60_14950 [Rhodospirillaceae bacterium]|nr:hypothetical protein [Rhodospirillales bacterium]
MSTRTMFLAVAAAALLLAGQPAAAQAPNPAMTQPDLVNWQLFITLNKNSKATPAALEWETWIDDLGNFPASPDPKTPPTWPSAGKVKVGNKRLLTAHTVTGAPRAVDERPAGDSSEETHRNKIAFDYIVANKMWYREGLADVVKSGTLIQYPQNAIEMKANWAPMDGNPKYKAGARYTLNNKPFTGRVDSDENGNAIGLVAMHIMAKQVPLWTWGTFEYVDNPGRCDFIGCKDSFGAKTSYVAPAAATGGFYSACQPTPALKALFKTLGGTDTTFINSYCLKGSQPDYVAADGMPSLLGNSVTEKGFVQSSSCITCHARASAASDGSNPSGFGAKPGVTPPVSYNGAPDPTWFYNTATLNPDELWQWEQTGKIPPAAIKLLPLDFSWGPPFCANSVDPTVPRSPCTPQKAK